MYKAKSNLWRNRSIWQWIWRNNDEPIVSPPSPLSVEIITELTDAFVSETNDVVYSEGV